MVVIKPVHITSTVSFMESNYNKINIYTLVL